MPTPLINPFGAAVPPLIPGSSNLQTLQVDLASIDSVVGDSLSKLGLWKGSVTVATTTNISLSGEQTIDGVAIVAGTTVLVKDQTNAIENGIYIVSVNEWDRSPYLKTGASASGVGVFVSQGSVGKDSIWVCTNDKGTAVVGTNDLVFTTLLSVTTAAGLNTEVQYNKNGSLAGISTFEFDDSTSTLGVGNLAMTGDVNCAAVNASGAIRILHSWILDSFRQL